MVAGTRLSVTLCVHCLSCSFFAKHQDWLWDTPSHGMKVAPHLHLVPRLRMIGVMLPLHHTPSWRAQSFFNRKGSDDGFLRVTWQFSEIYILSSVPKGKLHFGMWICPCLQVERWGGAYSAGPVRVNVDHLTT
jgi:hypothetical protein